MDLERSLGWGTATPLYPDSKLLQYLNLKLTALGCPTSAAGADTELQELTAAILQHHRETDRLLVDYLCPADQRIQDFLGDAIARILVVLVRAHVHERQHGDGFIRLGG